MPVSRKQAPATIRVLIADDHAVVREGIRHVLSSDIGFEVVGEAADGAEAVSLAKTLQPDVVVLDLSMPALSGLDAAHEQRAREHSSRPRSSSGDGRLGQLCQKALRSSRQFAQPSKLDLRARSHQLKQGGRVH